MFGGVNGNQDELILDGESGDLVAVNAHRLASREEFFDGEPAGEVAHGALGVQLDKKGRCDSSKNILPRNFFGTDGLDRNFGFVASRNHYLSGATNVFLAHDAVEIAILPGARVPISP